MDIADKRYTAYRSGFLVAKRIFDIVIASLVLVILLLPMLLITMLVKLTSKGPVIYKHERVGHQGKTFTVYKFRTMKNGTDNWREHLTLEQQVEYQKRFKLKDDPRITRLGKILRKTSLDELPQLFNVIKGEMSIIGPRPVTAEELHKFGDKVDRLISVKPGITGFSQVRGRSSITLEERILYDMEYIEKSNMKLDIKIFLKTIILVILQIGAV